MSANGPRGMAGPVSRGRPSMGGGPSAATVMIVEDHRLVSAAIREAIEGDDLRVVAEVGSGEAAIEEATRLRPAVLLVDIDLPGMSGLDLVRTLAPRLPETVIVMLTVSDAMDDVVAAMSAGAAGYLTKDLSPEALRRAVRSAVAGELAMPRKMAGETMRRLARTGGTSTPGAGSLALLSPRELQVLRLLADGMTDRQIAEALSISSRTVESHVASILRKLDVSNRAAAARRLSER